MGSTTRPSPESVQLIRQSTLRLLNRQSSAEELRQSCAELYRWFTGATDLGAAAGEAVRLPTGLCLPPDGIPDAQPGVERWVALLTRVAVFAAIRLGDYASGLTVPQILWPLSPARGGEWIQFNYVLDVAPGIRWTRL